MFCTNCGMKLSDNAKFCSSCGIKQNVSVQVPMQAPAVQTNPVTQPAEMAVSIPINLKTGLVKTEPYIILITCFQTALVYIDKELYKNIIAGGNQGGGYFNKVAGMMNALKNYGESLATQPVQNVVSQHPGSILVDNGQVKSLRIYNGYNANSEQYDSNYTLELHTTGDKFVGTLERGAEAVGKSAFLREIFGNRYR